MNYDTERSLVAPFYEALNQPATKDVAGLVRGATSTNWRTFSGETMSKGQEEFIQQVVGFGKLIPDLAWTIKDILTDGDTIVVRSEASGTPVGDFFGVPPNGRSFHIMTIDLHTVKEGKLALVHHIEDWATAIRQLASK